MGCRCEKPLECQSERVIESEQLFRVRSLKEENNKSFSLLNAQPRKILNLSKSENYFCNNFKNSNHIPPLNIDNEIKDKIVVNKSNYFTKKSEQFKNRRMFILKGLFNTNELDFNSSYSDNDGDNSTEFYSKSFNSLLLSPSTQNFPSSSFSRFLFLCINHLRRHPRRFLQTIEDGKDKIFIDNERNRILFRGRAKVVLGRGVEAFDEAEEILLKTKPMEELEYDFRMEVKVEGEENEKEIIKSQIKKMKANNIPIRSFYKDNIKDPETAFLLMVVDDTSKKPGLRRRDILDPEMKYIAITSYKFNDTFACYIAFGK